MTLALEPLDVLTDGGWREGRLVRADSRLAAVLVKVADDESGGDGRGGWYLEAGFGPCGMLAVSTPPLFAALDQATAWIGERLVPHALGK